MAEVQELNDESFGPAVYDGVTLVDFWATWCGPCLMQDPVIRRVAETVRDRAKVAKVNIDEAQKTATMLRLEAIPTLIVFKDGVPVRQFVGLASENAIMDALNEILE